jgi:carbon storage regulator
MLVISRKENQRIKIGDNIEIVVVEIGKGQVKIGIEAPKEVQILRSELIDEIKEENKKANKEISEETLNKYSKVFNEN